MLSNPSKYAINAVIYLAINGSESNKIGTKEISKKLNIPSPFLAKILQTLAKKKVISSTKGPKGGFWLTDHEKQAPLITIIENLDDVENFSNCFMGLKACSEEFPCPIHYAMQPFKKGLITELMENSIDYFSQKVINKEAFLFV
ncbi:RrF2 family transcriptional regulator [Capnocytophaga canis]|uniref:RrF2 family transcriptional regulator n=1 Tax=Capnocytophaga canis TaxID=1848903 RepID=UPI001562098E|nr:Rrf2 family transcriptional regulator [Capnocytophaga canis]GIM62071.1 putative HTH-type transcriptional regulator [Capnocytophaga canis]